MSREHKGKKDVSLARFDLIPTYPLWKVAEMYGLGARKYDDRNWELGYPWSSSYAALQRHLQKFWSGESYDAETGQHHLASVVFHAMALMEYEQTHPEYDDRGRAIELQSEVVDRQSEEAPDVIKGYSWFEEGRTIEYNPMTGEYFIEDAVYRRIEDEDFNPVWVKQNESRRQTTNH